MISKKSLVAVLDKSTILTITAPNDNANQDPVQCALPPPADFGRIEGAIAIRTIY